MWICNEGGNPGIWGPVGVGSGSIVSINSSVLINEPTNEISLASLGVGVSSKDKLLVHYNSTHLLEGVHFEISNDGSKIVKLGGGNWNPEGLENCIFALELFKGVESIDGDKIVVDSKLACKTNHVVIENACSEVEIGIDGFNAGNDMMLVFKNGVNMVEGVDYEVQGGKIVSTGEVWNENGIEDYGMTFVVFKEVVVYNGDAEVKAENIADGSIGMDKLADDVKGAIEEASNIDLSGYVEQEEYNGKIAELEGKVNEAFTSANNGKELIANAIGEPVSADDTFSAMSNDINSLLSTFKTNMMNNGITVESNDRFKTLIDKIATMVEEGSGKGIQYAEGSLLSSELIDTQTGNRKITFTDLGFVPDIIFISGFKVNYDVTNLTISNLYETRIAQNYYSFIINNITSNSCNVYVYNSYSWYYPVTGDNIKFYAIGVGEEDNTLRDSLASILTEEGVSVTEEDDMASLISKVDSEFTKDNNAISELEENIENTRNTLAGLMQEGGYDITGDEDINSLLDLLILSGISISDIKQIACGYYHTFILKNDGSVWSCGLNDRGQLGLNDTSNKYTFTKVAINVNNDVKQIACNGHHTFIIKNDGSVWSCGLNNYGQLGLGDTTDRTTFNKVTTNINNDVEQISCGYNHTFILKNDGSVYSCGLNGNGQLGLGDDIHRYTFTQVTNNDIKQIACGNSYTFILKNDGSVWACGGNSSGQLGLGNYTDKNTFTQVTTNINNDVKQVSCGDFHTFIIKNDGSVYSCGDNANGYLGLGDANNRNIFNKVTTNINNDVKQIACGGNHTIILKNDGSVYSCGYNANGQLGLDNYTNKTTFTQVTTNINNDVKEVVCDYQCTIILKNDGSVWCCGRNDYGQLGLGNTGIRTTLTMIPRGLY